MPAEFTVYFLAAAEDGYVPAGQLLAWVNDNWRAIVTLCNDSGTEGIPKAVIATTQKMCDSIMGAGTINVKQAYDADTGSLIEAVKRGRVLRMRTTMGRFRQTLGRLIESPDDENYAGEGWDGY